MTYEIRKLKGTMTGKLGEYSIALTYTDNRGGDSVVITDGPLPGTTREKAVRELIVWLVKNAKDEPPYDYDFIGLADRAWSRGKDYDDCLANLKKSAGVQTAKTRVITVYVWSILEAAKSIGPRIRSGAEEEPLYTGRPYIGGMGDIHYYGMEILVENTVTAKRKAVRV